MAKPQKTKSSALLLASICSVVIVVDASLTPLGCFTSNDCLYLGDFRADQEMARKECQASGMTLLRLASTRKTDWFKSHVELDSSVWIANSKPCLLPTSNKCPVYDASNKRPACNNCEKKLNFICEGLDRASPPPTTLATTSNGVLIEYTTQPGTTSSAETSPPPVAGLPTSATEYKQKTSTVSAYPSDDPLSGPPRPTLTVHPRGQTSVRSSTTERTAEITSRESGNNRAEGRSDPSTAVASPAGYSGSLALTSQVNAAATASLAHIDETEVLSDPVTTSSFPASTDHPSLRATSRPLVAQTERANRDPDTNVLITCQPFDKSLNAHIIGSNRRIHSVIIIVCRRGYVMPGGGTYRTVICLDNGQWSSTSIVCKALICHDVADGIIQEDGSLVPRKVNVGYRRPMRCDNNAQVFRHGQRVLINACIQVKNDAVWIRDSQSCKVRCPPVPFLRNSTVLGDYVTDIGANVTLICKAGHRFSDGSTSKLIVCRQNGTWSDISDCKLELCPNINNTSSVALNTTMVTYGTYVMGTCPIGYRFENGSRSMVTDCTADLTWSVSFPECILIQCREPPIPPNATPTYWYVNGSSFHFDTTITYKCRDGYRFGDGYVSKTIRCTEEGRWNETLSSCEQTRCEPVPTVSNAYPSTRITDEGTLVNYKCNPGYSTNVQGATLQARCIQGQWNITDVYCSIISCPSIEQPAATLNTTERVYGTSVQIKCDTGFLLDETSGSREAIVTCLEKGEWHGNKILCKPVDCGVPRSVRHAVVTISTNTTYKGVIHYNCLDGYWFSKDIFHVSSTCSWNGEWFPIPEPCIPVKCLPLSLWDGIIAEIKDTKYGIRVNYTCENNRTFADGTVIKTTECMSDGNWLPDVLDCPVVHNPAKLPPTESKHSSAIGYVSIAMAVILATIIISLDIRTLYEQSTIMMSNLGYRNNMK